ncbi:UNVERIFIED_CONTAM: hypothetical protein Sangu_2885300 [Sesamum angustifolium]|uniref:Uncharacterized protein n=1 Tax=Sesamum angustifolium TaxID=2727405 RepID=A0AAW2IN16_9LAMI
MEEAVTKEKKKEEEKRKLACTVGKSSRSTKRGTDLSPFAGGGNFSQDGSAFQRSNGPRFSGPIGLNRCLIEHSLSTMHSIGLGRGAGQSYSTGPAFTPSCSTCGRQHVGQCWGLDVIPALVITAEVEDKYLRIVPVRLRVLVRVRPEGPKVQAVLGVVTEELIEAEAGAGVEALVTEIVTTLLVRV